MILRPGDFAAVRINWRDKPANMAEIAAELKLGIDSLVFVDDNPAERELMRQMLPEVLTLEMPDNPTGFAEALLDCRAFDRVSMTSEDLRRTEMYGEQRRRMALAGTARSVDDFLRSLEMQVAIQPIDSHSFARAVDLIHKTNQFNLTTRRHSAAAVRQMMADARHGIFGLRVVDRFGDSGIVGIAIVRFSRRDAVIDTFALSCRVIGRTIETAFLRFLADWSQARGADRLEGEFVRTAKNAPAADLYERHGFQRMSEAAGGSRWALSLSDVPFAWPAYIGIGHETPSMVGTDARNS
jgi:FkbH-like protein